MELASALLSLRRIVVVEAISPVNAQKTDHRQEYPHANAGRPLDLEGIEVFDVRPAVSAFQEPENEDSRLRLQNHRIAQLDSKLIIDISRIIACIIGRDCLWRQRLILVSTQRYDVRAIGIVPGHSASADPETLERRIAPFSIIIS